ncbi:hypothetical protein [Melittangium boletus]|uniref:Lipoprotein n=1 Tax=Melittangium boletus DSM 14713 TaxID=1294270 RepID=A0A250ILI8_9BACT|nr:hypothetical protein [Melittangium boletus]ATB32614.1 hypothetical protein MEBOL_006102 [Melittangium boletus DSM 14713]
MYRVLPVLLLVLSGCRDPGAVQALIKLDTGVEASCIALDLQSSDGTVLKTQLVPRPEGKNDANIAVFRGDFPQDLRLQARALWGTRECNEPLFYNGKSQAPSVSFKSGEVVPVELSLSRPGEEEDSDRDGFVAASLDGPDCDDSTGDANPKAAQDVCDASADLNCNGQLGCDDVTCSAKTCSQVAASLEFTSASVERGVGECVAVVVERRDRNDEPTAPNYITEIQLGSSVSEGLTFHQDSDCKQSDLTTVSIDKRQASVRFYAKGTKIGERKLLANSTGLAHGELNYKLRAGDAAQVVFSSVEDSVQAGACRPVILERQDIYGNQTSAGPKVVTLTPSPSAQTAFYGDPACGGTQLSTADFAAQSSLILYFRSKLANVFPLNVSGIGSTVTRNVTVYPAPPSKIELALTPPLPGKTLLAGECSQVATVKTSDEFNNPSSPATGSVDLSGQTGMGVSFYSDSECKTGTTTASFGGTAGTANFYFKIKTGGVPVELSASLSGLTEKQSQTVTPTVRRGTCTMDANSGSKECTIDPKLNSRGQSFLVFQATSTDDTPRSSFVRCQLKDDNKVLCNRQRGGGSNAVQIQWQVVEMPRGLKVQQLEGTCSSSTGTGTSIPVLLPIADPAKAFLLYSSSKDGTSASANDFVTVKFNGDHTKVDIAMDPLQTCNTEVYSVQVVEFDGVSVTRGTVPGAIVQSPFFANDTFTEADANQSILMSTFQSNAGDDKLNLCNRMVRGEIDASASRLSFTRGFNNCNAPKLSELSWERIQFPANTSVQARTLEVGNGVSSAKATISAVDMSRTLLLASNQIHSGQGNGETSNASTDTLAIATGRLVLNSPTELEVRRDVAVDSARWTVYAVQLEP